MDGKNCLQTISTVCKKNYNRGNTTGGGCKGYMRTQVVIVNSVLYYDAVGADYID
jgi:hypothetical protein